MPNQPATPVRAVRIPDELWDLVERLAVDRGQTNSDIVRRALERYVRSEWQGGRPD